MSKKQANTTEWKKICFLLKQKRLDNKLSQAKLEKLMGVSSGYICKVEKGKIFPCVIDLLRLSHILKVKIIFGIKDTEKRKKEVCKSIEDKRCDKMDGFLQILSKESEDFYDLISFNQDKDIDLCRSSDREFFKYHELNQLFNDSGKLYNEELHYLARKFVKLENEFIVADMTSIYKFLEKRGYEIKSNSDKFAENYEQ